MLWTVTCSVTIDQYDPGIQLNPEVMTMNDKEEARPEEVPQPLYVSLILDESGSMQSCKQSAIEGFNQYLKNLREEPASTWFTLTLFNSRWTEVRYRGVPVSTVPNFDVETYRPQATTPLYDAIGQTLAAARQEAPAESKRLCVILTDGLENSSKEYTRKQIFALIKECEQEGWLFVYLGADHDVWAAGEDLGIAGECRVAFSKDDMAGTFTDLSAMNARYRRATKNSETVFRPLPQSSMNRGGGEE